MIVGKKVFIPLTMLTIGRKGIIVNIAGGEGMCRRLLELGFAKGAVVEVLKNDFGPLIVALGESRMVLGFGMAQKIMVEEV
jgi:ferrous iron transport protein A